MYIDAGREQAGVTGWDRKQWLHRGRKGEFGAAVDTRPPDLDPADDEGGESSEQGSEVLRAWCQEGKCSSCLSGTVSFTRNRFRALLTKHMDWKEDKRNQSGGHRGSQAGLVQAGDGGGRSHLGLRGHRVKINPSEKVGLSWG